MRHTGYYVLFEFLSANRHNYPSNEQNSPVLVQQSRCTNDMTSQYLWIPCENCIWYLSGARGKYKEIPGKAQYYQALEDVYDDFIDMAGFVAEEYIGFIDEM